MTYKHILIIFFFSSSLVFSQVFGKNKVRYKNLTWEVIETNHFEIYCSPKIEELGNLSASFAESAYKNLSNSLKMEVRKKIPLVIFASPYDFAQTNIILELIDKGVGGFAEVFKKRIAIPFTGSYLELERVINHELTHIFCYELLYGNLFESIITNQIFPQPPMWFMEGIATYYEGDFTPIGELVLKDAVLENSLIPLSNLSDFMERPYLAYQESHSLISYIAERYGEEVLSVILRKFSANIPQEKVIRDTCGISIEKLEDSWVNALKEKYWPILKEKKRPQDYGKKIFQQGGFISFSPAGDIISLISKEENSIFLINFSDGRIIKKIKKPRKCEEIKDIPPSWSKDGCKISFVGRYEKNDVLFVYSVIKGKIIDKIEIKDLDEVRFISFSPSSLEMVISGYKDGEGRQSILSLSSKELRALTFGLDNYPSWLDNNKILFLREEGFSSIWTFDIESQKEKRILSLPSIVYLKGIDNDRFLFISNLDGSLDVYLCNMSQRLFTRITNFTTGALSASFNPEKKKLAFSSYFQGREDVYVMDVNENSLTWKPLPDVFSLQKEEREFVKTTKKPYSKKFTLDYRNGSLLYDSRQGLFANIQMAGSDILGNNRFVLTTNYNTGLLDFSNLSLFYLNLSKRPSMGIGLFKKQNSYFGTNTEFTDSEYGIIGSLDYPFSKTRRIEQEVLLEGWERSHALPSSSQERQTIYLLRSSLVDDTSNWSWIGPRGGKRVRLTYEKAINPGNSEGVLEFDNIKTDVRKYISITKRAVLATRLFYEQSKGRDKREFPLGGVSIIPIREDAILRGYDYDEFWGNKILSGNVELRIPFIERLDFALGLSIGGIRSVIFYDFASFWTDNKQSQTLSSTGIGFRLNLFFLPLRLDYGWKKGSNKAKAHFSLGYDF
ncbi:MAG: BamA/TamA family outer membrane protein [bacterium]